MAATMVELAPPESLTPRSARHRRGDIDDAVGGVRCVGALYRELWRLSRGTRGRLLAILATLIGARLVTLLGPLFFAVGVNALQETRGRDIRTAGLCLIGVAAAAAVRLALYHPARTAERNVALEVRRRFTEGLYAHLTRLPLSWHEGHHSGEVAHRMRASSTAVFEFAQSQAFYVEAVVTVIGSIGTLLVFDPTTAIVALVGYSALFARLIGADRQLVASMEEQNEAEARLSSQISDYTGNAVTVVTLGLAGRAANSLREQLSGVVAARRLVIGMQQRKWTMVDGINQLIWCLLVLTAGWSTWYHSGAVAVVTVVLTGQYATAMTNAVLGGANQWQQLLGYATDHRTADPIREARPEPVVTDEVPERWREIGLNRTTLRLRGGADGTAGLRDIHLTLQRGERVALIGPSGAGKTTLLRVLAGVQRPDAGRILVDDVHSLDVRSMRRAATLVPQEAEIFTSTLRENLTLDPDTTPETLAKICRTAQLDAVLDDLPDGLDTNLAERGLNLSGGQRQRIALARALLAAQGCSLLLLDEPTSNLDPTTERLVYQGIFEAFPQACIVSSVHRLHLLPRFDRVVLMDGGRILDTGSVEELLARQGLFRAMWLRAHTEEQATSPVQFSIGGSVDQGKPDGSPAGANRGGDGDSTLTALVGISSFEELEVVPGEGVAASGNASTGGFTQARPAALTAA